MGAVVVLGAAYLPEMMGGPARDPALPGPPSDMRPKLTFEFDHLLRNSEVAADPEPYHSAPRHRTSPLAAGADTVASEPMTTSERAQIATGPAGASPGSMPTAGPPPAVALAPAGPLAPAGALAPAGFSGSSGSAAPAVAPVPAVALANPVAAPPEPPASAPEIFTLQAASFRSANDANRLRAELLLMDIPASTSSSSLADGVWYRVTVGPFTNKAEAERAMTRLREQKITAIWSRG